MDKTMQQKLDAMNTNKTSLFFHSTSSTLNYFMSLEYEKTYNGEGFKIKSGEYPTLAETVDDLYEKFLGVVAHNFKEAVPPQLTYESGSSEVVEEPPRPMSYPFKVDADDEAPF